MRDELAVWLRESLTPHGVIDAHVNVGRYTYPLEGMEADDVYAHAEVLVRRMDRVGVARALVCSLDALLRGEATATETLHAIHSRWPARLFGLATVSTMDEFERASRLRGIVGLKLNPRLQGIEDLSGYDEIFDACRSRGWPVMIHCGTTRPSTHPDTLTKAARRHPQTIFVWAHIGGTNCHLANEAARLLQNVLVETSVSRAVYEPIRGALATLGPERVMYGSDAPFGSMEVELVRAIDAALRPEVLVQVLRTNAERVFFSHS